MTATITAVQEKLKYARCIDKALKVQPFWQESDDPHNWGPDGGCK